MNLGIYHYINKPLCKTYYKNISISTSKKKKKTKKINTSVLEQDLWRAILAELCHSGLEEGPFQQASSQHVGGTGQDRGAIRGHGLILSVGQLSGQPGASARRSKILQDFTRKACEPL